MRPGWDEFFLSLATTYASRSTCDRLHVGCILVQPNDMRMVAAGYNGSLPGFPHCDDEGHDLVDDHCQRTIHAELNAVLQATQIGIPLRNLTAYLTHSPCLLCTKMLVAGGVSGIYYGEEYRLTQRIRDICREADVELMTVQEWRQQ